MGNDPFVELLGRLRVGDDEAISEVLGRYIHRLIVLANAQFDPSSRPKADPEGLVQSALASFFARCGRGQFELIDWGELWCMLATITLRKCSKRRDYLRAGRRDARREQPWDAVAEDRLTPLDRHPTPLDAAILNETIESLLRDRSPAERRIVELTLQGYTVEEIARQVGRSERTVWRVRERTKQRLRRHRELGGPFA